MELQKQENHLSKTGQINSVAFTKKLAVLINNNESVQLVQTERAISIKNAVEGQTIKRLSNELGEDVLSTILTGLILRVSSFFNIGEYNNISEDQAIETAYMLIDRFPTETIEDFVLMFKNAKAGKYGEKLYNRLDGMIIIQWMYRHLEEKAEYRERMHKMVKSESLKETTDFSKMIEHSNKGEKSVIDALKEGVNFDEMKQNEIDYMKFKSEFFNKQKRDNEGD